MIRHGTPVICRIRRFFVGCSPSAIYRCSYGLHHKIKQCDNCIHNQAEQIYEAFHRGLADGLRVRTAFIEELHKEVTDK